MSKRLLIHGGMPKTASTAIQTWFAATCPAGIVYPEAGRFPGSVAHHAIFYALTSHREAIKTPLPDPAMSFEAYCCILREEWEKSGEEVCFLSSELFWNPLAIGQEEMERLKAAFDDVQIDVLVYNRDPSKHAVSSYSQAITGAQKFSGSLTEHVRDILASGAWDYSRRLHEIGAVFGPERVHAKAFEEVARRPLAPISVLLNKDFGDEALPSENVRKSWIQVALTRRANLAREQGQDFRAKALTRLSRLSPYMLSIPGAGVLDRALDPSRDPVVLDLRANDRFQIDRAT